MYGNNDSDNDNDNDDDNDDYITCSFTLIKFNTDPLRSCSASL